MKKEKEITCEISNEQLLNYALENGIIDIAYIQNQIAMNERAKYIAMHNHKITQSKDGYYYTRVPDITKPNGLRMIKKSSYEKLEDAIIEYYKSEEYKHYIYSVFEEWMAKKLRYGEIQKQTYDRYKVDFERFFPVSMQSREIKYITEAELEDFIKTTIHDMKLTAKAWSGLRTLITGIFKYAKKMGYTNISISSFFGDLDLSKKIFTKKVKEDEKCIFTEAEMKLLAAHLLKKPTIGNLSVLFAMYTGMRVGEVVALKWEDITEDYIYVHRTQTRHLENGKDVYEVRDTPKTEAGIRKVVIVDKLRPIIKQLRHINPFTEYVFEKNGVLITKQSPSKCLYRACENVGIPKRSMHKLRKTFATRLINANVDEAVITNQMGHTDIMTTKDFYYYNDKNIKRMTDMIGDVINY